MNTEGQSMNELLARQERQTRDIVAALVRAAQIENANAEAITASIDVLSIRIEKLTAQLAATEPKGTAQ